MQPRRMKKQRRNKRDEDVNISNSDSTTNNNNNMANQVPEEGSDQVESMSRYLVQKGYYEERDIMKKFVMLKEKTDDNRKLIEDAESELKECEEEKKEASERLRAICDKETACKQRLAMAKDESAKISTTVGYAKSKVKRFLKCSVVDGLF